MGVNCCITLPPAVRLGDVADVLGALAGFPMERVDFERHDGWAAHRPSRKLNIEPTATPEMVRLWIIDKAVDGESHHHVYYHFEYGPNGERGMNPPSTPFWCAIAKGLVDFFGGAVDYDDCDDTDCDYEQPARDDIHASDDEPLVMLQERKLAVRPITRQEMAEFEGKRAK